MLLAYGADGTIVVLDDARGRRAVRRAPRARSTRGERRLVESAPTRACGSPSTRCTTSATGSRPRARPAATTPASSWPPRPPTDAAARRPRGRSPTCGSARPTRWPGTAPASSTMIPPTIAQPARPSPASPAAADALAAAAEIVDVPTILPRVIADDGGVRIVLPGDPATTTATRVDRAAGSTGRPSPIAGDARPGRRLRRLGAKPRPSVVERRRSRRRRRPSRSSPGVARALSPLVRRILAPNPGMMTGPGHQHLPRRHRRDRGHRPRARRRRRTSTPSPAAAATASAGSSAPTPTPTTRPARPASRSAPAPRCWPSTTATASRSTATSATATRVEATEFRLRAVHTPGHASNHLCFLLEEERLLFSGDHIMDGSTVVITPARRRHGRLPRRRSSGSRRWRPRCKAIAPGHGH